MALLATPTYPKIGDVPPARSALTWAAWREVAWPREHGSWSLAFEPVVLGLLAAPSFGGVALACAVVAGFFARRPLRVAVREAKPERRRTAREVTFVHAAIALGAFAIAVGVGGWTWTAWLAPTLIGGAAFLYFDLRNEGREHVAEVLGAGAFGFLPAAFTALAGRPILTGAALAFIMLARSVPTVLTVRAYLRGAKSGRLNARPAAFASSLAVVGSLALYGLHALPVLAVVAVGVLALRSAAILGRPTLGWRARTIGIAEAVLGLIYVVVLGLAV